MSAKQEQANSYHTLDVQVYVVALVGVSQQAEAESVGPALGNAIGVVDLLTGLGLNDFFGVKVAEREPDRVERHISSRD